ncbi:MAG TPA: hypothetical protein VLH75_13030 [Longimicrobiales bacterium]|nr:hypothetical protein [Longimicrobiales bacterium]
MTTGQSVLVTAVLVLGGCAHVAPGSPADPVEAAQARLETLLSSEGDVQCAAQAVVGPSERLALRADVLQRHPFASRSRRYRAWKVSSMDLSQAGAIQARLMGQIMQASDAVQNGTKEATAWVSAAMWQYDELSKALIRAPGGANGGDGRISAVEFAAVWRDYFSAPEGSDDRAALLEWLTSRSLQDPSLLRAYQAEFDKALRTKCR